MHHRNKSPSPPSSPTHTHNESYLSRDSVMGAAGGNKHHYYQQQQQPQQHSHYDHQHQYARRPQYNEHDMGRAGGAMSADMHYAAGALTNYTTPSTNSGYGGDRNVWTDKCVDLNQIIRYFRTNDYSGFDNETRLLVNTIRDICIDTSPLDVNVVKRFDSDENLMKNYERLVKENGGSVVPSNIFVQSFIDHVLPSYAQKFYNKGGISVSDDNKAEAAYQLGLAVKYQVAQAVTSSIPIPLPFNQQLANNYMTLLLKQAQIPPNIQTAVQSRRYAQLNNINDLINNVISNLFAGGNDYYYYVLNEKNRARIISLKENLTYLGSLSETANVFDFIGELATRKGKQPGLFREAHNITSSSLQHRGMVGGNVNVVVQGDREAALHEHYRRSLTEMAFQNEALRRFIFQELSYKRNKQND
ncbi:GP41 [Orgyia pseudotsugata single capsid nuclopolyhedrovirus]|nr:GP41 [Orgyia pseudotsugata single capsid nuclopolyhedrovirus]